MLEPVFANQFKKDYSLLEKRHKDMDRIIEVMTLLIMEEPLPEHCHNHALHGDYEGRFECHIQPDWLLIYRIDKTIGIVFYRTGTHSDLF
jgi:mRNA interferase YafQ